MAVEDFYWNCRSAPLRSGKGIFVFKKIYESIVINVPQICVNLLVADFYEAKIYYGEVLKFHKHEEFFLLPIDNSPVFLRFVEMAEEEKLILSCKKRYMSFSYNLEKNFLSHCIDMYERGAMFEMACEYPGGYFARICDPSGNQFEIFCDNFEEEKSVDRERLPCLFKY